MECLKTTCVGNIIARAIISMNWIRRETIKNYRRIQVEHSLFLRLSTFIFFLLTSSNIRRKRKKERLEKGRKIFRIPIQIHFVQLTISSSNIIIQWWGIQYSVCFTIIESSFKQGMRIMYWLGYLMLFKMFSHEKFANFLNI